LKQLTKAKNGLRAAQICLLAS
jgi:hypothetical protein